MEKTSCVVQTAASFPQAGVHKKLGGCVSVDMSKSKLTCDIIFVIEKIKNEKNCF